MPTPRWTRVSDSAYTWEAEAIDWLAARLPDSDAWQGWSNLEFVAQDGSVNEVDALILTPTKLLLVEIKSTPATVFGEAGPWTWERAQGNRVVTENPLVLANRKAKRLAGLLKATRALKAMKGKSAPYVEEVILLGHKDTRAAFTGSAGTRVFVRSTTDGSERDLGAYIARCADNEFGDRMDWGHQRAIVRALDELGIRPIQRQFVAGQWKLSALLEDAGVYQEYEGVHTKIEGSRRRVRVYPWPPTGPDTGRRARREAANREFRLLDRPDMHPGILRAQSLEETERGPAVVFEHPVGAERLDAFLVRRAGALDMRQRLRLIRELTETVVWAHGQGLHHRTLTPAAVLVVRPDDDAPSIKLRNWQVGSLPEATASGQTITWHDFVQVGLAGRDEDAVYLAPELRGGGKPDPALLDVFSLGALAWHLLTGRPPAASPEELLQRLNETKGLRLSAVLDGVDENLDALIQVATSPDLAYRPTASEFLMMLEECIARSVQPDSAPVAGTHVHPLDAEKGAELEGGFIVESRIGSGSTAIALRVQREGAVGVLKVARDPQLNDRLRQEGEVIKRLHNQHIIKLYEVVEVGEHVALFIELAGERTLAERLATEGALTLDLLQRFGDELLVVVDALEQQGIPHRDLKPDNIGVGETARDRRLTLRLFDFSLSTTPADNLRAGTPGYLDPFLEERKTKRWDSSAERYAAAVTLHEMATGALPTWGDGRQHPMSLPPEVQPVLAAERFDPAVRESLTRFFNGALARDPRKRFDTAEDMRKAWRDVFQSIDLPATGATTSTDGGPGDALSAVATADPSTQLAVLGLTPRVLNALERLAVHDVRGLAEFPRTKLFGNTGIGARTVRDIRDLADAAARNVAVQGSADGTDLLTVPPTAGDDDAQARGGLAPEILSVDLLVHRLVLTGRLSTTESRALRLLTGLLAPPDAEGPDVWPSQRDVAEVEGLPRAAVLDMVERARTRWGKRPEMTALRDDLARLLQQHGGVATREELARALARIRGTVSNEPDALRHASAVIWAALEVEASRETTCRYRVQRGERLLLVVSTASESTGIESAADPAAIREWVEHLGQRADLLADVDPPLPPARLLEELQAVAMPAGISTPSPERLLRLAVAASEHAALTPRQELYRRGLSAQRAVALAAGSLLGAPTLSIQQVRERIAARFPEAQDLPPRPALDDLLRAALVPLAWDDDTRAYRVPPPSLSGTSTGIRTATTGATQLPDGIEFDLALDEAAELQRRVRAVVDEGRFLVLTVDPSQHSVVSATLRDKFGLEPLSLERLLLDEMRHEATTLGAQWSVVLEADSASPMTADGRKLSTLVQRTRGRIASRLAALERPTLLLHPGLFAQYDLLGLLDPLQDRTRRGPGVVILIPADGQHTMPTVDSRALPVVHPGDWARVPKHWHRRLLRVA